MADFEYTFTKVCTRNGVEFYHILPKHSLDYLPRSFKDLKVKIQNAKFCILSFNDCDVTVFPSGRMLIENLPIGSEERARMIVKEIMAYWQ